MDMVPNSHQNIMYLFCIALFLIWVHLSKFHCSYPTFLQDIHLFWNHEKIHNVELYYHTYQWHCKNDTIVKHGLLITNVLNILNCNLKSLIIHFIYFTCSTQNVYQEVSFWFLWIYHLSPRTSYRCQIPCPTVCREKTLSHRSDTVSWPCLDPWLIYNSIQYYVRDANMKN